MLEKYLVVGPFNEIPVKATEMALETPGQTFPLIIIEGPTGSGKSAIIQAALKAYESKKILKYTGNEIMHKFIESIKKSDLFQMRSQLQEAEVFILEDYQELSDKTATQELVFQALKSRIEKRLQTIITVKSNTKINEIDDLYLILMGALRMRIESHSYEDKLLISRFIAKQLDVTLHDEIYEFIAQKSSNNLNEIRGSILKLGAVTSILKVEVTLDDAKEHLYQTNEGHFDDKVKSDVFYDQAVEVVKSHRVASASFLQRRLGIGYMRASNLIEMLERNGIIGKAINGKRIVMVDPP